MTRMEELASQFLDYSFIANNRDPYANCASILYRHYDAENINLVQRKIVLEKLANDWLMRSYRIKELVLQLGIPLLTYEKFCKNPSVLPTILDLPDGVSETINPHAMVKVKNYKLQRIKNMNGSQISNLTDEEIAHISHTLKPDSELLEFFGYQIK